MALALNESTWDLALPIRKATAAEAIRQTVAIRLKTRRGEWAFDLDQGLPFTESIFVKSPNLALIESLVRTECMLVTGVTGVARASIVFTRSTRSLAMEVDVTTDEGLLTVTV
jgi:hypothetical protein